ncbi:MAG: hypothetical protein ACT4P6_15970 [Gemmatimonadaceae bacterium]
MSAVFYGVSALILLWDVVTAGEIARLPRVPRAFAYLSAFCGLLVLPAAIVGVASSSILAGRAMYSIAWLWPVTLVLFAAQALYGAARRLSTSSIALPIAAYNLLVAAAGISRSLASFDDVLLAGVLVPEAAQANAMGVIFGREALGNPFLLLMPILVPASAARGRMLRAARTGLALIAGAAALVITVEWPPAARSVTTYAAFDSERLQERPGGDFALGMWILPALDAAPPPLALTYDLQLVDSVGPAVLGVEITPAGARAEVMDSLGRALEDLRRDTTLLVVALGYDRGDREHYRASPARYAAARLRALDRIVRTLRPDYLLPARDPYEAGRRALGEVPAAWWVRYFAMAADTIRVLRPRTRVALSAASFTPNDSALYHWAATPSSGIDVLGFSFVPSFAGAAALQARLRAADRWMERSTKEHWVFAAGETPATHGERNQARALWGTLAWATSRARINGLLVRSAGDYDVVDGIRAPGGRLRPVVDVIRRTQTLLAESRALGREP